MAAHAPIPPMTLVDKRGRAFTIRPLGDDAADRAALEGMYRAFEPKRVAQGLPPADARQQTRWLDSVLRTGWHLVVEIEGTTMGHGMLIPYDSEAAELANFLHQDCRDRGIGTALNRALLATGRARGITHVWLSVEPSNRRAIRSYEKVGFRRRPVSAWAPEIEMEISLAPQG